MLARPLFSRVKAGSSLMRLLCSAPKLQEGTCSSAPNYCKRIPQRSRSAPIHHTFAWRSAYPKQVGFEAAPQYEVRSQDVVEIEVEIDSAAILICMGDMFLVAFGSILHSRARTLFYLQHQPLHQHVDRHGVLGMITPEHNSLDQAPRRASNQNSVEPVVFRRRRAIAEPLTCQCRRLLYPPAAYYCRRRHTSEYTG